MHMTNDRKQEAQQTNRNEKKEEKDERRDHPGKEPNRPDRPRNVQEDRDFKEDENAAVGSPGTQTTQKKAVQQEPKGGWREGGTGMANQGENKARTPDYEKDEQAGGSGSKKSTVRIFGTKGKTGAEEDEADEDEEDDAEEEKPHVARGGTGSDTPGRSPASNPQANKRK